MIDINKPVQLSNGTKGKIIATNVLEEIPGLDSAARNSGQTILVDFGSDKNILHYQYGYFGKDGSYTLSSRDNRNLMNVPEEVITTRYAAVRPNGKVTTSLSKDEDYQTEIRFFTKDGKITKVELV